VSDHTDLTEAVCTLLCEEVRKGAKPTRACIAAGFHKNTWSNWSRKADAGTEPYAERVGAILRAEAICITEREKRFADAGKTDWKADEAFLKARAREDYGASLKIDASVSTKPAAERSDDELDAVAFGTAEA
jgi:hypothetical protein